MLRRLLPAAIATCLTFFAAAGLTGCVELNEQHGCTSDDDCRFGRICSELSGRCIAPGTSSGAADQPEAGQDAGQDASPDTTPIPDATPHPDPDPRPDVGIDQPDAPSPPDADSGPEDGWQVDVGQPDDTCSVDAHVRMRPQNHIQWFDDSITVDALATVMFDASESTGDITGYDWSIVEQPQGSIQRLLPDSQSETPRLFIDLLGVYRVELTVFGESASGAVSCQDTDTVEIMAHSGEDLHIQLVWETPGDPDQTDTEGSDLDLHYLHPNGRFGNPPWDIFWRNPTADWGIQGESHDDPTLDIDDVDGAGPENINHNGLENVDYELGVYMTDDADMGPSYATVRIYYHGQLVYERQHQRMTQPGDFWHVAKLDGQGNITDINELLDGYPFRL